MVIAELTELVNAPQKDICRPPNTNSLKEAHDSSAPVVGVERQKKFCKRAGLATG